MDLDWLKNTALTALNDRKLALLRAGAEIADLSMINPDIPPPRLLVDKLLELTVRSTNHRYAVARGVRRLREAFAQKYVDRFDVKVDPETDVCVTLGSKDGLEQVLRVMAGEDRRVVAVSGPFYPHYRVAALLNGYEFKVIDLDTRSPDAGAHNSNAQELWGDHFIDGCAALPRGSILLLNFPHNPTGRLAPPRFYEKLIPIVLERDLFLINDFVYGELVYSGEAATSILTLPAIRDRSLELFSLSKSYSVPGWRVGAVIGAARIVQAVSTLKSQIDYGIFLPIQGAAAAALHAPATIIAPLVEEYARRAQTLCSALNAKGWEVVSPEAGCAVWARYPEWRGSSFELASVLLEKALVSCSPGGIFLEESNEPSSHGEGFIRFALVAPEGHLRMVVDRITDTLTAAQPRGGASCDV